MIVKVVEADVADRGEILWVSDVEKVTMLGVFVSRPGVGDVDLVKFDDETGKLNESVFVLGDDIKWSCGSGRAGVAYRFTFRSGDSELGWFDAHRIYLMTDGGDTIDRLRSDVPRAALEADEVPGGIEAVMPYEMTTAGEPVFVDTGRPEASVVIRGLTWVPKTSTKE